VHQEELAGIVRAAFGPARRLAGVQRLRGGSKKGVYPVTLDNGSTAVGYIWAADENYWPAPVTGGADPFADASGADLSEASRARLAALGARTPQVYLLHRSLAAYPAEGPGRGRAGRNPADPAGMRPAGTRQVLAQAAARVERAPAVRGRLEDVPRELAAAVRPRAEHGLIHGEFGPDHVLVDSGGHPVQRRAGARLRALARCRGITAVARGVTFRPRRPSCQ
jgi:hypothetical protein